MADAVHHFDAVVIGDGLAGFSAALALKEKGKKVAIVYRGSGATSVSSGAWDFGPVPASGGALSSLLQSREWKQIYSGILTEAPLPPDFAFLESSVNTVSGALAAQLPFRSRFEQCFVLPCMSGALRRVFTVQASQAAADLATPRGTRFAVVGSRRWRFRGDFLARQWSERLKQSGSSHEFRALDLPLEGDGWDVPLTRVAAELLHNEAMVDRLKQAIGRLSDSVDGLVLPPIFPSFSAFEKVRSGCPLPIAEALAWTEPTAGYRLYGAIQSALEKAQIPRFSVRQLKVSRAGDKVRDLTALFPGESGWATFKADAFVLASGRFFGGGLQTSFQRVEEAVFALSVHQDRQTRVSDRRAVVEGKADWNRLGICVDADFRPLAEDGRPHFQNLYAAGSIIGGVDYSKHQIGLGFAVVTGRQCAASIA